MENAAVEDKKVGVGVLVAALVTLWALSQRESVEAKSQEAMAQLQSQLALASAAERASLEKHIAQLDKRVSELQQLRTEEAKASAEAKRTLQTQIAGLEVKLSELAEAESALATASASQKATLEIRIVELEGELEAESIAREAARQKEIATLQSKYTAVESNLRTQLAEAAAEVTTVYEKAAIREQLLMEATEERARLAAKLAELGAELAARESIEALVNQSVTAATLAREAAEAHNWDEAIVQAAIATETAKEAEIAAGAVIPSSIPNLSAVDYTASMVYGAEMQAAAAAATSPSGYASGGYEYAGDFGYGAGVF